MSLFRASRSIAAKHFDIRLSQVDVYTKTSSIFNAARTQAPPAFAAAAQSFSQSVAQATKTQNPNEHIPHQDAATNTGSSVSQDGIKQDHFYKRSDDNAAVDPVPEEDLAIKQRQADREPLPDGTIPPRDSVVGAERGDPESFNQRPIAEEGQHPTQDDAAHLNVHASNQSTIPEPSIQKPLSSEEAMKAQRQSESQIPKKTADPPTPEDDVGSEFSVDQEQDIFYQPPDATSPVLSALPRMRVPKIENDVQAGDSHIPPDLNADVYYSGNKDAKDGNEVEELSEEQLAQIFSNPRIARMLGNKGKYIPKGVRSFHTSTSVRQRSAEAEKDDIKQLAADMAKDVQETKVSPKLSTFDMVKADQADSINVGRCKHYCSAISNAGVKSPRLQIWTTF